MNLFIFLGGFLTKKECSRFLLLPQTHLSCSLTGGVFLCSCTGKRTEIHSYSTSAILKVVCHFYKNIVSEGHWNLTWGSDMREVEHFYPSKQLSRSLRSCLCSPFLELVFCLVFMQELQEAPCTFQVWYNSESVFRGIWAVRLWEEIMPFRINLSPL